METSYSQQVRNRIDTATVGTVFTSSDFMDIADKNTIRRILDRLTQSGKLKRVLAGVYLKPRYSEFLKEYMPANPETVAKALARSYHWTIGPTGYTALNILGLSTQVPMGWAFVSDGPYRTYNWGKTKVEFLHRTSKDITGFSYMTILVIQALKTLGRKNLTFATIQKLRTLITKEDLAIMLQEAPLSTNWVYKTMKQIAGEESQDDRFCRIITR